MTKQIYLARNGKNITCDLFLYITDAFDNVSKDW